MLYIHISVTYYIYYTALLCDMTFHKHTRYYYVPQVQQTKEDNQNKDGITDFKGLNCLLSGQQHNFKGIDLFCVIPGKIEWCRFNTKSYCSKIKQY